jgi:hypothetical protein
VEEKQIAVDEETKNEPKFTPDQIAALESERDRTVRELLSAYRSPIKAAPVVVEEVPVEEIVIEPVEDKDLTGRVIRAQADIENLRSMFEQAQQQAMTTYQAQMSAAQQHLANLQAKEQVVIDHAAADRLSEVLAAMREGEVENQVIAARESEGDSRAQQLRRRCAPVLRQASETRALLREYDTVFGSQLENLQALDRQSWLIGIPAEHSALAISLFNAMERSLAMARESRAVLEGMLTTTDVRVYDGEIVGGFELEILNMIERSATEILSKESERTLNWCVQSLSRANSDALRHLQNLACGAVGQATRLRELKSPTATEAIEFVRALPQTPPSPGPAVAADANWNTNPLSEVR